MVGTFSTGIIARLIAVSNLLREVPVYLIDELTLGLSVEVMKEFNVSVKEYIKRDGFYNKLTMFQL